MKTPSDDLFTLIKSLNSREKVFFKIYSANKSANKDSLSYLKLFDVIDTLQAHDESLLIARLAKTGFKHDINKAKNYLAEAILNSLEEYHSDISVSAELQKLIHRAEVLISKKLSHLANKVLFKAENLALKHEMYDYLILICPLKTKILDLDMNMKDLEEYQTEGVLAEQKYLKYVTNMIQFRNLLSQVRLIQAKHSAKVEGSDLVRINSILSSPLLASPDQAFSFSALKNYNFIHFVCSMLLDKWNDEMCKRQKEWISYLELDKNKLSYRTEDYCSALINLMLVQLKTGKFDEADLTYEKNKQFYSALSPKKRTKSASTFFASTVFNYIGALTEKGMPEKSLKTWEQGKEFISFNTLNPNVLIHGCYNLSMMYFMLGNYHDALKWVNKILNCKETNWLDAQAMSRIYLLLIHYELKNYDMLPYLAKSAKRFFIKHNSFSQFKKTMIAFFERKMPNLNNREQQIKAFSGLKEQIENLYKNSSQMGADEYFDFISWIESKISNKPLAEIVRGNIK